MKFVHVADMHFDAPFTSLNTRENLGEKRRLEQRNAFKKMIDYIKENSVDYLFISGDLYEHEYVKRSTIEFISKCFSEIADTKIFISPGNHDPYLANSYYSNYDFGDNVYIFRNNRIERYEDENVNIYGMAFNEFYMDESPIDGLILPYSTKPNILLAHVDLNGSKDNEGMSYNPISEMKLESLGFNYCALGHIHKRRVDEKSKICYPGSMVSLGFDEMGSHGMIVGEILFREASIEFKELDERKFEEVEFNISKCTSQEDLVYRIATYDFEDMTMYKAVLVGNRSFNIDTRKVLRLLENTNVLKIKDNTTIDFDIERIVKEKNLKGYYVQEVLKRYDEGQCSEEECQKAIEIVLNLM